jgi:peptidoglycan hydrolase-like amidase
VSSSLRRGAPAAAAIAFSIVSLAACGAGNNAQTNEIKPDNAATSVGDIKVQNAIVVTQPDLESTGPAVVSATVFNNGRTSQTLDSITVVGTGKSAKITSAKGKSKLTVPAHGSVVIGGKNNASAVLPSSRSAVKDGNAQRVTFTFSDTGPVNLRAFVVPAEHYFSSWGPSEMPSAPSSSASASQSPSGSASPSSSASDSASASATTSADAGN